MNLFVLLFIEKCLVLSIVVKYVIEIHLHLALKSQSELFVRAILLVASILRKN